MRTGSDHAEGKHCARRDKALTLPGVAIRVALVSMLVSLTQTLQSYAVIINVPGDQPTIQAGVDAASDGDTVLVKPGTYVENVLFYEKEITVGSLHLTTHDSTYIRETVVDGDCAGPVFTFLYDYATQPVLDGFTVTNGAGFSTGSGDRYGGGIYCDWCCPRLRNLIIRDNAADEGGGVYCWFNSYVVLENVVITDNTATGCGGGMYCFYYSYPSLSCVTVAGNSAFIGGGIACGPWGGVTFDTQSRSNVYLNRAVVGNDLYVCEEESPIDVFVDTFTVASPTSFFAYPAGGYTFDILNAAMAPVDADLYVAVDGDDANDGLSWGSPLRTIDRALYAISADSTSPHTIHLAPGTYAASTNSERYPLSCRSFVSLRGSGRDETVLDGVHESSVIHFYDVSDLAVQDLTITRGTGVGSGGGVYLDHSSPVFERVDVTQCASTEHAGGGICCEGGSNPSMRNVSVLLNSAHFAGGGVYCSASDMTLRNVVIAGNASSSTGGGLFFNSAEPSLVNVTVAANAAAEGGGGIHARGASDLDLVNCIVWGNSGGAVHFYEGGLPSSVTVAYCDVQGGQEGIVTNGNATVSWLAGNIDENPLFADLAALDLHLTWTNYPVADSTSSPCIDAGSPDTTGLNLPPLDPDGNERIIGDAIDMGAYEYVQEALSAGSAELERSRLALCPSYPNPFSDGTRVAFGPADGAEPREALVRIYDVAGSLIRTLEEGEPVGGRRAVTWDGRKGDGRRAGPGVYLYRLEVEGFTVGAGTCVLAR